MSFSGGGVLVGSGQNAKVAVGLEETAYGTSAAAQMYPGPVNTLNITREDQLHETRGMDNLRTLANLSLISTRYRLVMAGELVNGVPLAMALGYISGTSDPTLGVLKGPTHTTPTKSYLPSWTGFRTYDEAADDSLSILGWVIDRATFGAELDGPITFNLEGPAKAEATTAAAPTLTSNVLGAWNTTLSVDEGQAAYGGGSPVTIDAWNSWSFTVSNNPEVKNAGPTASGIRQPIPGKFDGTLEINRRYIDKDLWADLLDGTLQSFRVLSTDGTVSATIDFDNCINNRGGESGSMDRQSENVGSWTVKDINAVIADSVTYSVWD